MLSSFSGKKDEAKIPGIPADFAAAVARVQGREPSGDDRLRLASGMSVAQFLPISTEILAKPPEPVKAGDAVDLEGRKIENYDPEKDLARCGGIYLGTWEPKDNSGRNLGRIFDLYAAPEDIGNGSDNLRMTFNNAVKHVAGLRNYHGHNGGHFANEKAVLEAVRNNPASLEKWFLPTKEILHGKTSDDTKTQPANLYDSRDTGAFKNTFITKGGSGNARWYWSLTERPGTPPLVYVVKFSAGVGNGGWLREGAVDLSLRVVRAKLRP